ncbi:class I SAM-dependent methyltransferase [Aeribacillus sp. FSL K6-8210]|uniref:class I SAM-dependent methyltransferase n=1 Tax=Aeribacillus sp. FSL K6-8210 TaxID=2954683 RepID=UPI0030D2EE9B
MFDKVVLNKYGFYELKNKPNPSELEQYYSKMYYQESNSTYRKSYSDEEIKYFYNKIEQKHIVVQKLLNKKEVLRFLDVGCGEGWALKYFSNHSWEVKGLDYSSYGCEMMNPECLPYIIQGDIFENLDLLIDTGEIYDVILLDNVLEHVLNPEELLNKLKKIANKDTILIIEVPNDFSIVQKKLLELGSIQEPFWIVVPDHISYFNNKGLTNLCEAVGWKKELLLADYPIDLNLLNEETNYILNRKVGKSVHQKRIIIENLLHEISIDDTIRLYNVLAEMGLGRNIVGFFRLGG